MDQNQPTPFNNAPVTPMSPVAGNGMAENGHKKVGPIIATLVIVLILIIAALYVFASRINQQAVPTDNSTALNVPAAAQPTAAAPTVAPVTGTANDPASLQKDLNASTQGLDAQTF